MHLTIFLAVPQLCLKSIDLCLKLFDLLELFLIHIAFFDQQILLNLDFLLLTIFTIANDTHLVLFQDIVVLPQLCILIGHLFHFCIRFKAQFVLILPLLIGVIELLLERIDIFLHLVLGFLQLFNSADFVAKLLHQIVLSFLVAFFQHHEVV